MATCWKCFKRCRADISCLWCRRGPMCLNCECDCPYVQQLRAEEAARVVALPPPRRTPETTTDDEAKNLARGDGSC
jgi:hypothetical protein